MPRCPRCSGALFREDGDERCIACGRAPGPQAMPPTKAELERDVAAEKSLTMAVASRGRRKAR